MKLFWEVDFIFDIWKGVMFFGAACIVIWGIQGHRAATGFSPQTQHFRTVAEAKFEQTPDNRVNVVESTFDALAGGALTSLLANLERLSK